MELKKTIDRMEVTRSPSGTLVVRIAGEARQSVAREIALTDEEMSDLEYAVSCLRSAACRKSQST